MPIQTKIFLSHASEDKARILQIHATLIAELPEVSGWLDRYEIVGGDSLIERIADGMDQAEKFFIFLSPISVTKPWVQAELRRALNQEINGIKPGYIVPVIFGGLTQVPAFLEDKRYIDLDQLTKPEWIAEFDAAIRGSFSTTNPNPVSNLDIKLAVGDKENIGQLQFRALAWAEPISFTVRTSAPVEGVHATLGGPSGGLLHGPTTYLKRMTDDEVSISLPDKRLSPGNVFVMTLQFKEGVSFLDSEPHIEKWDGAGSQESGTMFLP